MSHATIWTDNDNLLELNNLTLAATSGVASGATVTARILNGGSVVSGASDITLVATSGGSNDYRGVLGSSVALPKQAHLNVEITAVSSSGADGQWTLQARTRRRSG